MEPYRPAGHRPEPGEPVDGRFDKMSIQRQMISLGRGHMDRRPDLRVARRRLVNRDLAVTVEQLGSS
jgi:hypothetical protein